ncbi:MAG: hypothetical protein AB7E72_09670 [Lysobacterales bacterium]
MNNMRGHLQIAFESIQCFADDGRLDADELGKLVAIAERDGVFDQDEVRILSSIIKRIKPEEIDEAMRLRLDELSQKLRAR